jgi:hypothetical protein
MNSNNILSTNPLSQNSKNNSFQFQSNNFLQRKRNPDDLKIFSENNQKTSLFKQQKNENEFDTELENNKLISDTYSNSNNSIINGSSFAEKENKLENNISDKNNDSNFNNIINNLINCKQNDNINKPIIIKNNNKKFENINSNPDSSDSTNNNIKNKYFNITNYESEEKINNNNIINTKKESPIVVDNERNNEIKVLKNNKAVYVNSYLLNSPSASKKLKQLNKITFIGKSKRSSKFRGVSKNGNQWQVLLMYKKGKSYVGSYSSEEFAARIYDILAIKLRGVKARTNFKYSYEQIKKIGDNDFDIKSKNINDIIAQFV